MKINLKKTLKYFSITLITIIILLVIAIFSLRIPAVQNFVKGHLITYLEDKIQTKVTLEKVYIDFPSNLEIKNLYLQGQDVDTLLYVKNVDVGLDIWQLLKSKADINSINLDGVRANVVRNQDGAFNFDYITNAFATTDKEEEKDTKPFIISLDKIKLKDINVSFVDKQAENNIKIALNQFDTRVKTFDLDKNNYAIGDIVLDGLKLKLKQDLVKEVAKKVEEKVDSLNQKQPMKIDLKGIQLTNFDIDYGDDNTQLFAKLNFKEFKTTIKKIDLEKNSYDVGDIKLNGLNLKFNQKLLQDIKEQSTDQVDKTTTTSPLQFALNKINLNDINVEYGDDNAKMYAKVKLNDFNTIIHKLDLEQNNYQIGDINLDGLDLVFNQKAIQKKTNISAPTSSNPALLLDLNKINLSNIKVDYNDQSSRTTAKIDLKDLKSKVNKIDLDKAIYDIDHIILKGGNINANLHLASTNSNSKANTSSAPMNLELKKLLLDQVKVNYNNTAVAPTKQGMDYNHLRFSKLNVDVENFKMANNSFTGSIKKGEIKEARGLNIQRLNTDFFYGEKQAYLKNLHLQTPRTLLRDQVNLSYQSMNQLTNHPENVIVNATIRQSKIGFADILMLVPTLRNTPPFDKYPNGTLNVDTQISGKVNDLAINHLNVSGLDDLQLSASGRVKNAMNPDKLYYDLAIKNFSTSSKTIYSLVPKNTIPSTIRIPSKLSVNGKAKGSTTVVNTQLNLTSTLGDANLDANIDMRKKDAEKYSIKADLKNLDVGTLISNKDLGKITAKINAKGESFNPEKMNTTFDGTITSATYNKYNYKNVALDGKINNGAFSAHLNSDDPNANLNLIASGVYKKELTDVKLNGEITKIDINKLGFYATPMIVKGAINANFDNLNPDELNGTLLLKDFAISDTKEIFPVQEMSLIAVSTTDYNQIKLNSQIADAELNGKFKLTQIFGALAETVNEYYNFQDKKTTAKIDPHQYFTLNAKIKDDDLIRKFLPDLSSFETIVLNANYNADDKKIVVDAEIPNLTYGKNVIDAGNLHIDNTADALNYKLNIGGLKSESFQLKKIDLNGDIAQNTVNYSVSTKDDKDATQFLVAGNVKLIDENTNISLNPNGLVLNYDQWQVKDGNLIQIQKDGIVANNFSISNNGSEISIQSDGNKGSSPLNIAIKDFKIETITELIKKDDLPASGIINGTATIKDLNKEMTFNADLNVTELQAFGNPVGNLVAKIQNTSPSVINANIALTGNNNDLKITGDYNTKESAFDMLLAINRLEMKTIQGFSMNAIKDTEGFISGNLNLNGTIEKPSILGKVQFNEVGLTVAETGSNFRKINDAINFTSSGIELNKFKINDADGNSLTLNGYVLTETYRNFTFGLTANARNFKVVNSEKSSDALMYGVLAINANLNITGDMDLPVVDGSLKVTDKTNFTFVLPQSSPSLQEREGIVEFIDQDQVSLQETIKTDEISSDTKIKGFDVNVNIDIDKEAKTSLIIDKANGDFVEIQGEAQLTGGMDPSGKTTLVGVYQVEKGAYELSVSLLKRRFEIQKGSTITWTGEPTTANLDITAVYIAQAAPIDLVEQQISGLSSSEMNMYKQRMPFNTNLMLKGELLKPIITFDISLNEDNPSIPTTVLDNTKAKLDQLKTDEAEMNKQVFALLLLNRFVGENPFQSQSGMSAETMAKQSVSNILSQQLNNLASDLIKGVDIDFGLDTQDDYSTGSKNTRTDLNVAVSKRLLNDRLKVSIGSNFGLEGDARENENMTNIAGDITVDYSLSRDGRYMLRAYRKNEYQVALQGQIIETGVGFIITLDYDKFKEIFEKRKRNRSYRQSQKAETK